MAWEWADGVGCGTWDDGRAGRGSDGGAPEGERARLWRSAAKKKTKGSQAEAKDSRLREREPFKASTDVAVVGPRATTVETRGMRDASAFCCSGTLGCRPTDRRMVPALLAACQRASRPSRLSRQLHYALQTRLTGAVCRPGALRAYETPSLQRTLAGLTVLNASLWLSASAQTDDDAQHLPK